jgi:hypothetical protein
MVLTLTRGLATLAQTVVLLLLFVFISTNLAVLVLRKDRVEHDHFRVPVVLPVAALASCVLLLTQQGPEIGLRGGILLAIGAVLYVLTLVGSGKGAAWDTARRPNKKPTRTLNRAIGAPAQDHNEEKRAGHPHAPTLNVALVLQPPRQHRQKAIPAIGNNSRCLHSVHSLATSGRRCLT